MEQGKEDSLHYHSNILCSCHPTIHVSLYVKSMKMSDTPPDNHNIDPTSSTMHHTVQAACMQVMSLTSHILAHGIAVTDRSSGGATNIVVGKGSNGCNKGVFCCNVGSINIDHTGVAAAGTANSTPQFTFGVGTAPCRAWTGTVI